MASGNRASMREGPLAQLFRKTEDDAPQGAENRKPEQEPKAGRPLPKDGPAPQTTRHVPEPQGQEQPDLESRAPAAPRSQAERMTEAARRAEEREARRQEREQRWSRYEGVPSPEDRLRSVFSSDIPENILEHAPEHREPAGTAEPEPMISSMSAGVTEPMLRVVGVGGAGVNAVNRMIEAEVEGVEFIAINTDMQSLEGSAAHTRVHIGSDLTRGLGSGSNPELGQAAALESYDELKGYLKGSDMVFITAGSGGGTGTGAAPIVARISREIGALDRRHRDEAVLVRGRAPRRAGRPGRRGARARGGHADRDPELAAPVGARQVDLDGRGLPRGRRRAAPGRPGHLRPDHAAGPHQPRLRRRPHDHGERRSGAARHRHGHRRAQGDGRRRARDRVAAARDLARGCPLDPALRHRRTRPVAVGGQRGRQGGRRGGPSRRRTSSSAPWSTRRSRTRCG